MKNTYYVSGDWNFICSSCSIQKESKEFYLHSNGKPRKQCKSCMQERKKEYSKEEKNQFFRNWVKKNKQKALYFSQQWRKKNLEYDAFRSAYRRAIKKQRFPSWANKQEIKKIYLNCPEGYHVDHVLPLQGKYVSGLHVETNLQYLPAIENWRKNNVYVP